MWEVFNTRTAETVALFVWESDAVSFIKQHRDPLDYDKASRQSADKIIENIYLWEPTPRG